MKKKILFFPIVILIGYILLFPADTVDASKAGLLLWYEKVLPTLLPFAIISNILIYSNYMNYITKYLAKLLNFLFPVSEEGSFIIGSGFLFGFPMGSKNCAELLKEGKIDRREADILFCISNHISPVFISSFILLQQLHEPEKIGISLVILYVPALLLGIIFLKRLPPKKIQKKSASGFQINFKIIDTGIMNGFETLAKIGGYIMLFSILISLAGYLPLAEPLKIFLFNALELTNGINSLAETAWSADIKYICAMTSTAFGGLSGIAQTSSMVKGTSLSMKKYCLTKLFLTFCTFVLSILVCAIPQ